MLILQAISAALFLQIATGYSIQPHLLHEQEVKNAIVRLEQEFQKIDARVMEISGSVIQNQELAADVMAKSMKELQYKVANLKHIISAIQNQSGKDITECVQNFDKDIFKMLDVRAKAEDALLNGYFEKYIVTLKLIKEDVDELVRRVDGYKKEVIECGKVDDCFAGVLKKLHGIEDAYQFGIIPRVSNVAQEVAKDGIKLKVEMHKIHLDAMKTIDEVYHDFTICSQV